jgi:hypothetical protein
MKMHERVSGLFCLGGRSELGSCCPVLGKILTPSLAIYYIAGQFDKPFECA